MMSSRVSFHATRACIVSALLLTFTGGCQSYPQVTSAESQEFIKQVYTACNTQNPERVATCVVRLKELTTNNLVSDTEAATFRQILELAESGDWSAAQQQALAFAQRQVR